MRSEETRILGELYERSRRNRLIAQRLFKDWPTWERLRYEFRRQVAENGYVLEKDILMSARSLNIEV